MIDNIINKQFYVKSSTNTMWIVIVVLSGLALLFTFTLGSTTAGTSALPLILGIIHLVNSKKPILVFNHEHAEYKNSPIGGTVFIKYSEIKDVTKENNKLTLKVDSLKRPLVILLSTFNESDREHISDSFQAVSTREVQDGE